MKALFFSLLLVTAALTSCSHSKKATSNSSTTISSTNPSDNSANDGSSYEKAIVIEETSETKGVSAEYAWLKKNYPGYKVISQSLSQKDNKPYDILRIQTADGTKKEVYFDISNFFGKF